MEIVRSDPDDEAGKAHVVDIRPVKKLARPVTLKEIKADPFFKTIKPVTLLASLKFLTFRLWDEHRKAYVGFR